MLFLYHIYMIIYICIYIYDVSLNLENIAPTALSLAFSLYNISWKLFHISIYELAFSS